MKTKAIIVVAVLVLIGIFSSVFVVDETEQVVVTQFGKAVGDPRKAPGLYFKIPVIQHTNYFPKNLLEWDGDPGQIPTLDKTYLWVDVFARWKIVAPLRFFETAGNINGAQGRLDDIIDSAVRNFITSNPLIETVRMTDRELDTFEPGIDEQVMEDQGAAVVETAVDEQREKSQKGEISVGRRQITNGIKAQAQPKLKAFGIELVDVKIKRLNYVDEVQKSVFNRMIAERKQIAEKFRSEGQGEARKIEGDMERDLKQITSEAYRSAQEIKGKADAQATRIYAQAFGRDPDFYSFMQSMDIYKEVMDKGSSLILSTDTEFLKYFEGYRGYSGTAGERAPAPTP